MVAERSEASSDGSGGWSTAVAAAWTNSPGDRSGGRRPGRWLGDRVPPQLQQVVGAAQQLPLGLAGAYPAAHEAAGALLLLDLAEHRLDGLAALGVAGLAVLALELGGHGGAEAVALGCRGLAVLAGLALAAVLGRRDQQLGRVRDGGEVIDRPVAGVGQQRAGAFLDARGGQRGGRGLEHGLKLVNVVSLVGELGRHDELAFGGDRLGVIALHAAVAGVQEAAVRVGDVGTGIGVGGLLRAALERARLGTLGGRRCGVGGDSLLVGLLPRGGLGLQLGFGLTQPRQPVGLAGQRLGQLVATGVAEQRILALVGLGG